RTSDSSGAACEMDRASRLCASGSDCSRPDLVKITTRAHTRAIPLGSDRVSAVRGGWQPLWRMLEQIGRYRILDELGRGATGIVYRAQDPAIGRVIAIKTIRLTRFADENKRDGADGDHSP